MEQPPAAAAADSRALNAGVGFVWLATGLGVVHPFFRTTGTRYLQPLGLPDAAMYVACVVEVVLGLCVLLLAARAWLAAVQVALVAGFTLTLAIEEPGLLVDPFGVLSKNVSLIAFVLAAWLLHREGRTPRAEWTLRLGLAFIWVWEGVMANTIFQTDTLRSVIAAAGVRLNNPGPYLAAAGIAEGIGGVALLVFHGRLLRALLAFQAFGLVLICVLVTNYDAVLWFHSFGPLTKNVALLAGTLVLMRVAAPPRRPGPS
jgi:hypothetical protein